MNDTSLFLMSSIEDLNPSGDIKVPDSVLIGSLRVFDVDLRFTALRVETLTDSEGYSSQHALDREWQDEFERLCDITGHSNPLITTKLPGYEGDYVVYTYPHEESERRHG